MLTAIYTVATLLFIATPSTAGEWTQFRGPTGDGISAATHVPVNWTATEHVVWKQAIPGLGWSSPLLSHGKLYLTTAEEVAPVLRRCEPCVSMRLMGTLCGTLKFFGRNQSAAKEHHSKNSVASPSPILTSDRLYVHFGHLGTAALDLNGRILWRQSKLAYKPRHGNGGSPVLVGNSLIFSCDAAEDPFVVALNCDSGDVALEDAGNTTAVKTFSFCTPTVIELDGVTQVIIPGSGFVGAYNPQDGKEIWRVQYGEGYSVVPRPVFANGLLFVATGFERPTLLAIDPKGATGDATDKHVMWSATKGTPLTPSMLAVRDELYTVTDNGVATCFDSRTGDVHWTQRLAGDFSAVADFCRGPDLFSERGGDDVCGENGYQI